MSKQRVLIDTNILVYAFNDKSSQHGESIRFLETNIGAYRYCLAYQNLVEFYSLVTGNKSVDNPLTSQQAAEEVRNYVADGVYEIILPKLSTIKTVGTLLEKYPARGPEIHDVHLAAVMLDNGVDAICTYDSKIFSKLGLKVISPR
jgi:predicted nucleic acid-binding protein